jgi:hypothetical protein
MKSTHLSHILCGRLIHIAQAIAFASMIPQFEVFTGSCGLQPSRFHMLLITLSVVSLGWSFSGLIGRLTKTSTEHILKMLTVLTYLLAAYYLGEGKILLADRVLIESATLLFFESGAMARKFVVARMLLGSALGKFIDSNCDGSWMSFGSLQSDALNQPFPFTPVWHLAQLPGHYASVISMGVVACEFLLPLFFVFSRPKSAMENAVATYIVCFSTFYYSLIGNFNWSVLIVVALCLSVIDSDVLVLLFGEQIFQRWGFEKIELNESRAEALLLNILVRMVAIFGVIGVTVGATLVTLDGDLWNIANRFPVTEIGALLILGLTFFAIVNAHREVGFRGPILILLGLVLSGSSVLSIISFSTVPFKNDYSSLPTCYSFSASEGIEFPVHSKSGRAGFLFQTKYSVIGTNTVGSELGGTKYAELSLPGSVHADEQRPPFLLGHLPRLALRLWKMGTGDLENVRSGLGLVDFLSGIVRDGGNAIRVFFPDTDDKVMDALIDTSGKRKNEIRGFYQQYQVTSRAADHQWWKRSYDNVAALPSLSENKQDNLPPKNCSIIIPAKLFGYHLDTILITGMLGILILKILFTDPRKMSSVSPPAKSQKKNN